MPVLQDTGDAATVLLAKLGQPAAAGEWERYPSQKSTPLALTAGQKVLLEAVSSNTAAAGTLQVGVRVPGSSPK